MTSLDNSHTQSTISERMGDQVRVRFAPSPTGNLHIGGARTAIYNWAFARHFGGKFILRIEDTDPERSTPENTAQIIRSLKWLGLDWDEGPEIGGEFGPYLQTERFDTYSKALEQLKANDAVYPCFCSSETLASQREAAMANKSYSGYARTCRDLSKTEAMARIQNGEPHTWRLKIPLSRGDVSFEDLVFGHTSFPIKQLDDFILVRSDGSPTYNYVVCLDDALMKISHVIRGDDHLSNTPKQILVYEALGMPVPKFAHLSMILGSDGKRLSKRHGATSVEAYKDEGYFPQALLNYLALLGWSMDGTTTLFDSNALCANFSLERVSKNPAIFDEKKLEWINASYIKDMGAKGFVDALAPYLADLGMSRNSAPVTDPHAQLLDGATVGASVGANAVQEDIAATIGADAVQKDIAANRDWYEAIYPLVAERIKTIAEALPMISYLFSGSQVHIDEASATKCLDTVDAPAILKACMQVLADPTLDWSVPAIEEALRLIPGRLELKPKLVFQAIRVAICGHMVSPPLFESIELIGRENCLGRLEKALRS